jgi:hypothetical protein
MNDILKILVENTSTFKERNTVVSLIEGNETKLTNTMVSDMYKSMIDKSDVDFSDIPKSKGDITKYSGYNYTSNTIELMIKLSKDANIKIPELVILETAMRNIIFHREQFEKAYKLNNEFIILNYEVLVACLVEATSIVLINYIDFIRTLNGNVEFKVMKSNTFVDSVPLNTLEKFNTSVRKGEFSNTIRQSLKGNSENFLGGAGTVSLVIIGVVAAVIMLREAVFYLYYARMKLSDYLKVQALFLEVNKNAVESRSDISQKKKDEIIRKQSEAVKKLYKAADFVKVDSAMSEKKVKDEIKSENKVYTLDKVSSQTSNNDVGFSML